MNIGIAGGGLIGSLLAWRGAKAGAAVTVYDKGEAGRCSAAGAGMLSPLAELVTCSRETSELGRRSIGLWRSWLAEIAAGDLLGEQGTILTALPGNVAELDRQVAHIAARSGGAVEELAPGRLAELEPELDHVGKAYHLAGEGHLDSDRVIASIDSQLARMGVAWHANHEVSEVGAGRMQVGGKAIGFDWCCDCRGIGAGDALGLRPVRGEIIHLHAPHVRLARPVRLAHPRYPIYVVGRPDGNYLVGATEIESGDTSNISVLSALELLSSACGLHPGFASAEIVESRIGLRPATMDNEPLLAIEPGLVSINGMYRHGFLAGPALVQQAVERMLAN